MSKHIPRRGDKVNDTRRIPHANGVIQRILYDGGPESVMVKFDNGVEFYDYEDLRNRWTDDYGGTFILVNIGAD